MAKDPGQTLRTARPFQINERSKTVRESLSSTDRIDFWQIKTTARSSFNLSLKNIVKQANADVFLLDAAGRQVASSKQRGNKAEQITNIVGAGTFYVQVKLQPRSTNTRYALAMSATPTIDLFGNSFATATPLVSSPGTAIDFVGNNDPSDFLTFGALVAGQLKVGVTGLQDDANLALYDGNRNLIAASNNLGVVNESLDRSLTDIAGSTYYLQISQAPGKDTVYNLSYSYTPFPIVTAASGLSYIDLTVGTGATPQFNQRVTVQYTGIFVDGTKFDSSRDRNQPFSFNIGIGAVIAGWDEGISTMAVGARRQLIIPPNLAYGVNGVPGAIPSNATLIFDVEVISIG